jgi:hypothetical protein
MAQLGVKIGDIDPAEALALLNGALSRQPFLREVQRRVREYADEWIDSGQREDGELPLARTYGQAAADLAALFSVTEPHWLRIALSPGASAPAVTLMPMISRRRRRETPALVAQQISVQLLASDWRFRLAKCRYKPCGTYFALQGTRQKPFQYGTSCTADHGRRLAAGMRTSQRRKDALRMLVALAAKDLRRDPTWIQNAGLKHSVLKTLNQFIDENLRGVTTRELHMNWFQWHRTEIDEAIVAQR